MSSVLSIVALTGGLTIGRSRDALTLRLFYVNPDGQLTLNGVELRDGAETNGGAIFNHGVVVCNGAAMRQNVARNRGSGGAVFNTGTAQFTASYTTIQGNQAEGVGGAIFNDSTRPASVSITNSLLTNNYAIGYVLGGNTFRSDGRAGAIYNTGAMTIVRTSIGGHASNYDGGAIQNTGSGNLTVMDSHFEQNGKLGSSKAAFYGGAIRNFATLTVSGTTFLDNSADNRGAAISAEGSGSHTRVVNATFWGNDAIYGTSLAARNNAAVEMIHCTMFGNDGQGTTVWSETGSSVTVTNCIVWNTATTTEFGTFNGSITASSNIVRGSSPDPRVTPFGYYGGPTVGPNNNGLFMFGLQPNSPAINAGVAVAGVTTDQRGETRGNSPDIGAFEFVTPPSLVVTSTNDVVDPADAKTSLREALAYASTLSGPQTITFDPSLTASNPATVTLGGSELVVNSPVTIRGPGAKRLTVSGNGASRVFRVAGGQTAIFQGLTIADGKVTSSVYPDSVGGGIWNEGTLTLSDCVLTRNSGAGSGGAVGHTGAALTVERCAFTANQTLGDSYGACLSAFGGTVDIRSSTFWDNQADSDNGGNGGAIANFGAATTITNGTFTNNKGANGGAIIHYGGTMTLRHCTISGNVATATGGGIERVGRGANDLNLINCIVAANTAPAGPDAYSYQDSTAGVFTSQGHNLIGIVDGALGFTAGLPAANADLVGTSERPIYAGLEPLNNNGGPTLTMAPFRGSPAINAGAPLSDVTTDQRGFARIPAGTAGLLGRYYALPVATDPSLLSPLSNLGAYIPDATVLTPRIDFGAGTESSPGDGTVLDRNGATGNPFGGLGVDVGTDNVAVIWTGNITIPETADYRFTTRSDDGSVLYVDDQLVVNNNNFQGATNASGTINLITGRHSLRIGYFEGGVDATMQVSWEQLAGTAPFARQIIAPESLSSGSAPDIGAVEDAEGNDDPDGDTLTNVQELNSDSDPTLIDSDQDGYNDATEMLNNSNPTDTDSVPPSTHLERVLGYGEARGLDLSGNFPYAVNVGPVGAAGQAGDAVFTADDAPGVTVSSTDQIGIWSNRIFGTTAGDDVLEKVYQSIRWSNINDPDPERSKLKVTLSNLVPGRPYKLQLLFGEAHGSGRRMDVFVNGNLVVNDFAPSDAQGGVPTDKAGSAVVYPFTATSSTLNIVVDGSDVVPVPGLFRDPYLNGLTVEDLSVPYTVADAAQALRIAGGLAGSTSSDARLNVETGNNDITVADALRLVRKAAGKDANP